MGLIAVLDGALVNQIAAGEVVERPASVVKELVENAIDAGATRIDVELVGGGRDRVRVIDNGSGMSPEDARLCLERHATSKIRSLDDLLGVRSLGFRGEAIPSIASVARFTLRTRAPDALVGTQVRVEGGVDAIVSEVGSPVGTDIDVADLFFNVPVRRKFLRTAGTELGHCLEEVLRVALIHPHVDFAVRQAGRVVLQAPAVPELRRRVRDILGDVGAELLPVEHEGEGIRVHGWVSPPQISRASRIGATYLFVNGRFVRDPVLRRAVANAFEGRVATGRFPVMVLHVELDPHEVDVNAHPAKVEVRFRDPRGVVEQVERALVSALTHGEASVEPQEAPALPLLAAAPSWTSPVAWTPPPPAPPSNVLAHPDDDPRFASRPASATVAAPPPPSIAQTSLPAPSGAPALRVGQAAPVTVGRPLAALADRYLLIEDGGDVLLLDWVLAAHALQRVEVERDLQAGRLAPVAPPVHVPVAERRIADLIAAAAPWGIELERFGAGAVVVKSAPRSLARLDWELALLALVDGLDALLAYLPLPAMPQGDVAWRTLLANLAEAGVPLPAARWTLDELAERLP